MRKIRILAVLLVCMCLAASVCACAGKTGSSVPTVTIAYQGGIGYAPVHVMEAQQLIEKNFGGEVEVKYIKLDSGASINEGIIGGTIQVGCMGISPAISAVSAGVPCKIMTNLTSQSHGLMSNDPSITSLKDITSGDKIALVNTGSIQHILLAMAAEKELGDPHALDNNIQAMAHAEGMAALESGTVTLHLTSSPFINQERESGKYTELASIDSVWPKGSTFLVALASTKFETEQPELFKAVTDSFAEAIEFINTNEEETVAIESKYLALDEDTVRAYLADDACRFFPELKGVETMIDFMYRADFIENKVTVDEVKYPFVAAE